MTDPAASKEGSANGELARVKEEWREMIAHDLRAPLANIYGVLRIIEDRRPGQAVEPAESLLVGDAVGSCRRLLEVVNLYMDILQMETGMAPVRVESVALKPLAEECAKRQEALALQRGVRVTIEVPRTLAVDADEEILGHVVENLLNNALKFTPSGGQVTVAGRRHGARVELSVKDTGPGLDVQTAAAIFDRFRQAKARHEGRIKGNGLGLAYCKEAMAAMRGDISVATAPQKGCDFVLGFGHGAGAGSIGARRPATTFR